ncbi:hypothetical protein [Zongyangia hominis]|uniref:Uncharacterized protein n=1 Tax=Zongyangia hominis TaxID=2763677 RepID=A0A926EER6_9FIRM|nr:hypothetical protein [Zongyangia hominis]MBC8570536.1 hypothetical protein [Zongyangia hominis]
MAMIAAFHKLYQLKAQVRDLLAAGGIPDADILCEFPAGGRSYPLRRPCICVGLRAVTLSEGAMGSFVGLGENGEQLFGRKMAVELRFDIYLPKSWEKDCHYYFCALCDLMTEKLPDLGKMWCGEMCATAQNDGFTLPCYAALTAFVCRGEEEEDLTQIILRRND